MTSSQDASQAGTRSEQSGEVRKGAPLMSSVEKGSIVRSPHTHHLYPCIHNFIISKLYFNYSEFLT